jgi:hypothetical protein
MKHRNLVLAAVLLSLGSPLAFADGNNNQNNSDIITNNYTGDTNTYNTPTAYGGVGYGGTGIGTGIGFGGSSSSSATGGQGGQGGTANSTNINAPSATGGSVRDSGNSNVDVRNTNTNLNSVNSSNRNDVNSTNINANSNKQGQGQGQLQGQGQQQANEQGQSQTANNSGVTGNAVNINVAAPKTYRPPVNSAIAPTIFPTAPCMGSSSIGGTGTLFSISGGTSWTSDECMILETARSFDQAGYAEDGLAVRCQGKWAKLAPSCKALEEGSKPKPVASAKPEPVVSKTLPTPKLIVTKAISQTQPATPAVSANGYYSVNTNPLTK